MATTKTVHVTSAQKRAARLLVSRSAKTGKGISATYSKIANAKSSPRTTILESHAKTSVER